MHINKKQVWVDKRHYKIEECDSLDEPAANNLPEGLAGRTNFQLVFQSAPPSYITPSIGLSSSCSP